MSLSARDRQRLQWGVAIAGGVAGVLYAYAHLVILPLVRARGESYLEKMASVHAFHRRLRSLGADGRADGGAGGRLGHGRRVGRGGQSRAGLAGEGRR